MRSRVIATGLVWGALVALGCSSSDAGSEAASATPGGDADAGGLVWGEDGPLDPPPPGQGIQYLMRSTLDAGQEIERCMLVKVGADGLVFNKTDTRFTQGSHHVLLYETSYTEMPTHDEDGHAVDPTQVHDCPNGGAGTWDVTRVIGGSQNFNGPSAFTDLPADVGVKVKPGAILLLNTHFLNTAGAPVTTEARINVWTVDPAKVTQEAGVLFLYNPFIKVGANASAKAEMRCPVTRDVTIGNVQSHMHRRGVGYSAWLGDDADPQARPIYTNDKWEEVPIQTFPGGLAAKKGQTLDYVCEYQNPESRDVYQGLTTKDEMCMLLGPYWPRDTALENCVDENGDLAGTWVGHGDADGAATMSCLLGALKQSGSELKHAYFGCITNACPAIQREVSSFARCQLSMGHGKCSDACSGGVGSSDCSGCMTTECGDDYAAAAAKHCE